MRKRLTVVAVIKNNKGEVLLGKMPKDRGVYPGQWAIPGGGVEGDETIEEALRREIKEETGLSIRIQDFLYFRDFKVKKRFKDGKTQAFYMISLPFLCEIKSGKLQQNDEFDELKWFSKTRLKHLDLNYATRWLFTKIKWL